METGFEKNGLYYEVIDEKKKTVKVRYASWTAKPTGALSIPGTIENEGKKYTVTEIGGSGCYETTKSVWVADKRKKEGGSYKSEPVSYGWYGFEKCDNLTSVKIPDSVNTIGFGSFRFCAKLAKVQMPPKLLTIESLAFARCQELTSITLPNTVKTIGHNAFLECTKLKEINIPTSMEVIESDVFNNCISLKKVHIPSNINAIKKGAFIWWSNDQYIKEVIIDNSDDNLIIESGAFNPETKITYKGKGLLSKLFGK